MRIAPRLVPGLLAGSLAFAGASGVMAAKTKQQVRWAAVGGQISNLAGSGFTLTLNPKAATKGKAVKTVQVTVAAGAIEKARVGTAGPLANGDYAVIVGARNTAGVTARRIMYSATAFRIGRVARVLRARHTLAVASQRRAVGTVQSSGAGSLVITNRAGKTLTFVVTTATRYRVNGQPAAATPTLTPGQTVRVVFTVDKTTKQFTAVGIAIRG